MEPILSPTVESKVPTASSLVPTVSTNVLDSDSPEPPSSTTVETTVPTNVWVMVDYPKGVRPIGIKWVLKKKKDERGIVIRNKARLVAQGYTQEKGIDYKEVFAPVARIKAIRLLLAYASYMGFTVYQMDVKSAFLYGTIDEEVYVMQPPGFEDPEFPDKVYRVDKAMYGLHQAPRSWYGTLSKYLLANGFQRDNNVADLLTKPFDVGRFQYLVAEHVMKRLLWCIKRGITSCSFGCIIIGEGSHSAKTLGLVWLWIETANGETHIIAKINGKQVPVSESSIRRKLKLKDEEGISDLPDTDLFANLSWMGYNILPNQRFSFQKGQFTHQWKFLIHTIMQCLSPKSTAFNEFSSNIATAIVCLATNRIYNFSKMIFDGMITNIKRQGSKKFLMYPRFLEKLLKMSQFREIKHTETYPVPSQTAKVFTTLRVNSPSFSGRNVDLFESMLVPQGEGPVNPTEPHHTPSPQASFPQSQEPIPHKTTTLTSSQEPTSQQISTPSHTPTPRRLTKRAIRIAQSKALTPGADEPASPPRDDSHGEAFPTATSLDAGQDRENIPKTSAMPHESSPRVTSLGGDEGSLQLKLNELMDFCTKLQSQHSQMAAKIQSQDLEISQLKTRIKTLEDAQTTRGDVQEDAPNRGE
ncbi:retrovirus-related pol polyprotein from transposon TNT 1-94 [Tanacetum coccineum]|uniref:Retrovirus-related pol polyprotein from transposon TNT 1-94 n=1 Tax=Tanacetum coccineum TaxID=301880 RepID=A0ABQ5E447_9ASTR